MITQKTQLATKIKDQEHSYHCPSTATLLECYEALNIFRSYVYGRIKEDEETAKASQIPPVENAPGQSVTEEIKTEEPKV